MATTKTNSRTWFSAKAADRVGEIFIFDEIGFFGVTAKDFAKAWRALAKEVDRFEVMINSPGGDVLEASGIFGVIANEKKPVDTHIAGFAWSAAGWVAMAGDKTFMSDNGVLMIHNPSAVTWGDAKAHQKTIDALATIKSAMSSAYQNKSGKSESEIAAIMDEETWLTAEQALEAGFVDEIEEGQAMAAHFDTGKYVASGRMPDFVKEAVRNAAMAPQSGPQEPDKPATEVVEMSEKILTIEALRRELPELVAQVERESGVEAVKAERVRIAAIREASFGAHQDVLVDKLIAEGTGITESVIALNKDHKAAGAAKLVTLEAETAATHVAALGGGDSAGGAKTLTEAEARAQMQAQFKAGFMQQGMSDEMAEAKAKRAANL